MRRAHGVRGRAQLGRWPATGQLVPTKGIRCIPGGFMRHAALIGALCTVCVTACSDDGPNISGIPSLDIIRVDVAPKLDTMFVSDTLRPGDRLQMKAEVIGRLGQPIGGAAVAWASSKPEVAVVDENGLVVPTGYGTTVISASASS